MSETSISNSVDNNLFNGIEAKLNKNVQLNTNFTYRELISFIKDYRKTGNEHNIIDQGQKISYNIPEKLINRFLSILERCRRENLILSFSESQKEPSGIMLDFDILQEYEKSQLEDSHFYSLSRKIIEMLSSMVEFDKHDKFVTYVLILRKHMTEYKEADKCFKDGFHMLIPGIKVDKVVKKYLIKKILESKVLQEVFDDVKFKGDINEIMDKNSAHVPTLFPGNCKSGKRPYEIYRMYKVEIKNAQVINLIQHNFIDNGDINFVHEFSVNYNNDGGLIEKRIFNPTGDVKELIEQWSTKITPIDKKNENDLSILSIHDTDSEQLKKIIDILKPERCIEYKDWFSIVCALAYTNERYKPLAFYFSGKRPKGVRAEFEKTWLDAVENKNKYNYSKEMIFNYARIDNNEEYKKIMNESIFSKLSNFVFDQKVGGHLDHWHIAQLLKEMLGRKFLVDKDSSESIRWYEFILPEDTHTVGEVYKWRCCKDPHTLLKYMSCTLPILFDRFLEFLSNKKSNSTEENQSKYYNTLIKVLVQSCKKLYNNGFKNGVMRESETVFRNMGFTKNIDTEENIMGVGNGVLLFDKIPILIQSYHHYKISRYSRVNYKKIDPDDPVVQAVYKSIWDLFPEDEKDAFHYVLFFLSTSLTGRLKACLFLTLRGNGANGKSYLMELVRNLLGGVNDMGYGCKLPIQYLIEREPMSNNASPVLMPLKWARMTYFSESDKSEQLRVSKKKKLTSHEPINVRPLYGKQENIVHKSNFILETNYALTIDTNDHGTWRRERYYTMKTKFCKNPKPEHKYEKKDDPTFSVKKTRDPLFLSGMLSILAMYFSILDMEYDGDINNVPCPTIVKETELFRNSQDVINRFITERVVITPDGEHEMSFNDLVDTYCRWYDTNIKEKRHDKLDISLMFKNSKLGKHVIVKINGACCIKGHRVLGPEEEKTENERYMLQPPNIQKNTDIDEEKCEEELDSTSTLKQMYSKYMKLIEKNNIKYW